MHPVVSFTLAVVAGAVALGTLGAGAASAQDRPEKLWVFVGTYTGGKSKGIYRCVLDLKTGKLSAPALAAIAKSPSFLAIHPTQRALYAVGEADAVGPDKSGSVTAFALAPDTGALLLQNQQPSSGSGPCYIVVDKAGKHALVANYGGGSATVLPVDEHGKLGKRTGFVQHKGSSIDKGRQEGPHAHSINLDAANRFAFVADLGLDKVLVYRFDPARGTLTPNDPPAAELKPGAGPRHFAFHPDGKTAYVNGEMDLTVNAFAYDAGKGTLTPTQTLSTVPKDAKRQGASTAEVAVHPSGRFVYVSNRGHDSIAIFAIDPKTRALTAAGHQSANIKTPRNFAIDPTGTFLVVANQDGDSLVVFRVNQKTGALDPVGEPVAVPAPVCVRFVPMAR